MNPSEVSVTRGERRFTFEILESCSVSAHLKRTGEFYELEFLDALGEILADDTVVFDVGAHIGNHTVYLAGVHGFRVMAFEPNPIAFAALEKNVRGNGLAGLVTCVPVALSSEKGTVRMGPVSQGDVGTMSIVEDAERSVLEAPATVLDEYFEGLASPVFLKVDVEGHESDVLRGGNEFIRRLRPTISVEIQMMERFDEILALLGPNYVVRDLFNATPTALFEFASEDADRERKDHIARYGIRNALDYGSRRNWYIAHRDRAERLARNLLELDGQDVQNLSADRVNDRDADRAFQAVRNRIAAQSQAETIVSGLETWLREDGRPQAARWVADLRQPENLGASLDAHIVVFAMSGLMVPASLLSCRVRFVEWVECDPEAESPISLARFSEGHLVDVIGPSSGFGDHESGPALLSTFLLESEKRFGPIDVAVFVGGEMAVRLESGLRSFIDSPYIVISHHADYIFTRLATLTGAAAVALSSPEDADAWMRSQIIPAEVIDLIPTSVVSVLDRTLHELDAAVADETSVRDESLSKVLLVSYYAPPATPVSVQRLRYWHERLPSIAPENHIDMSVTWLTATYRAGLRSATAVVPDKGHWRTAEKWYRRYQDCVEAGLDPLGISWSHYVEESLDDLGGPYSTVILSGNPFQYFWLGSVLKEKWNSKVILDFRDPFALNPRHRLTTSQREYAERIESEWVSNADAIISVNEYCLETVAPDVQVLRYVVANGFDEAVVDSSAHTPKTYSDVVKMAYSGTVFRNLPLDPVLNAMPENRFELHHFGRDYSVTQATRSHPVAHSHGLISYSQLIDELRQCAAGLIMTTGEPSTQTTKLFDYLACDLEVVIVTSGRIRTGNLHDVTKDLAGIHWVKNDPRQLARFFRDYEPTTLSRPERYTFSRRHQTRRLFDLIQRLEER